MKNKKDFTQVQTTAAEVFFFLFCFGVFFKKKKQSVSVKSKDPFALGGGSTCFSLGWKQDAAQSGVMSGALFPFCRSEGFPCFLI